MGNPFHEFMRNDYEKWEDLTHMSEIRNGHIVSVTFGEYIRNVNYLSAYLIEKGYKGANIGIYSPNSIAWMTIDAAVMTYVGLSVGISKDWKADELDDAIGRFDINLVFYSIELKDPVDLVGKKYGNVRFICIEEEFADILLEGKALRKDLFGIEPKDPDLPAKMVFTSGTTSYPKGVMLSVNNMFASYEGLGLRAHLTESDVCYLFLPLNHTYATVFNYLYSFVFGYSICLAHDMHNMANEMGLYGPTAFCAVPVVFKRFIDASRSLNVPLKDLLGGHMRYVFSGGAALPLEIRKAFSDEGICIMNSYGLSETASAFSIDYPDVTDPDSSGKVMETIDAKVLDPGPDGYGELALKGRNVFKGYYGDPGATERAFTEDGYFRTGDIGTIKDGTVYVRGRKDTMITLGNGENVASEKIASRVKALSPLISSVKVYVRDGLLSCDIYTDSDLTSDIDDLIEGLNDALPNYERIRKYNVKDRGGLLK